MFERQKVTKNRKKRTLVKYLNSEAVWRRDKYTPNEREREMKTAKHLCNK